MFSGSNLNTKSKFDFGFKELHKSKEVLKNYINP